MSHLLEKLGIELHIFIAQVFNFLILLFILRKFLYIPLLKVLDKRKETIEKGLADAKEAEENLLKAENIKQEKIIEGEKSASEIIDKSKKTAEKKGGIILKEAQDKSENIIKEAKIIAEEEKKETMRKLKEELGGLIAFASSRVLGKKITVEENEEIIREQLDLLSDKSNY